MDNENSYRFMQLTSLTHSANEKTFTAFLERLANGNCKDVVSWVCDHYRMSERVWSDIWS